MQTEKRGKKAVLSALFTLNIQFGRYVDLFADIFAIFLPLAHAFAQQVFDLSVDRAEVILRPCAIAA